MPGRLADAADSRGRAPFAGARLRVVEARLRLARFAVGLGLFSAVFCLPAVQAEAAGAHLDLLRTALESDLAASSIRGAAIRVVTPDEALALDWGTADERGDEPVVAHTRFRAGSFSKLVTSLLVLRAESAGRLALEDPVLEHVEGAFDDDRIKLAHLLEHTSGLAGSTYAEYGSNRVGTTPAEYVAEWGPWTPRWAPGLHFSYANAGHTIAARAVETAWGDGFDALVDREVFTPLGMDSASFAAGEDDDANVSVSFDSVGQRVQPRWHMPVRPSGALVVTADDLVRLVRMLIARGQGPMGETFLPRASIERMERARTGLAARAGAARGAYGLGSFTWIAGAVPLRGHWGRTEGFQTNVGYHAEAGVIVVVMVNTADRIAMGLIRERIGEFLGPSVLPFEESAPDSAGSDRPAIPEDFDLSGVFVAETHDMPLRAWLFALFDALRVERVDGLDRLSVERVWPLSGEPGDWVRVGPALYRAAEGVVPTATLVRLDGERFWVDGESYRAVPAWRFHATRGLLAAALGLAPCALVVLLWHAIRTRSLRASAGARVWLIVLASSLCLWGLFFLFVRFGLLGELDEAASLGAVGPVSMVLFALSLGVPGLVVLGAWSFRRTLRGQPIAALAVAILLAASAILAVHGWIPLRTWGGA